MSGEEQPYGLTRRMRETLLVIQELIDAGTPPTFAEICAECEYSSRAHAYDIARRLQARGWLDWQPHCARSFRLLRRVPPPPWLIDEPVFVGTFEAPALAATALLSPEDLAGWRRRAGVAP